ncbi:FtsW/RodA/SpoVE family cell cycle protein [Paenibacillus qinlingensis]|uniref:Cell division protein FtsW (Lipid II flippase) n=1 Tax=Paenibacillus qinlingensis TaxID=1837343 RepID=A0ABU1NVT6_9BACL|nr:FtsW/RodA/SpoVE family cell cycle protein [Paenibacillus qinlingensis]MDR6551593.1 cell division protein FtsW (lipid II flippase) [Paenibacillus qinlingensis]
MNNFRHHEEITAFLKQVCREIKAKEVHKEVRAELLNHLEELIEEKLCNGVHLDRAVKESIAQMGAADVIGQQFHLAHRPRFNWGLLAIVVLFMTMGLVAIFSAQAALVSRLGSISIGLKQIVYLGVGSCLMLLISFSNYLKLARFSWGLYLGTIVLLIYVFLFGNLANGSRGYVNWFPFQMNLPALSPYLLLIALAGIWSTPQRDVANEFTMNAFIRKSWTHVGTVWLASLLILSIHSIDNFVLFFIGCLTLLLVLKMKRTLLVAHCSLFAVAFGWFLMSQSYKLNRIFAFLRPTEDQRGMNFLLTQSKIAMQSGGWSGNGFGAPLNALPDLQAEMMFPFLIYCFGWGAGITMVIMVTLFVQQMIGVSRKARDPYGKALVSGLLTLFVIQYVWNMLMWMGLAPFTSFHLPFISYSGSLVIFQFVAIGLMLSVYRRKDLGTLEVT